MEASTAAPETEIDITAEAGDLPVAGTEVETPVETSPGEVRTPSAMFKWSDYVHVGEGAEVCEEREDGGCTNPVHFHAFCRMPNTFQTSSLREKALAAKARKARQLRDESSDGYEILEDQLDRMRRDGDESLIEEIIGENYLRDSLAALREIKEREEYKTVDEDLERFRVLSLGDEADRPADEYNELEKHLGGFEEALKEARVEEQKPQREALAALDTDELIAQIRDLRIESESNEEFMRTFSLWQMYLGTLKPRPEKTPNEKAFGDINLLLAAAPEVVDAIKFTFDSLETQKNRGGLGNS